MSRAGDAVPEASLGRENKEQLRADSSWLLRLTTSVSDKITRNQ